LKNIAHRRRLPLRDEFIYNLTQRLKSKEVVSVLASL